MVAGPIATSDGAGISLFCPLDGPVVEGRSVAWAASGGSVIPDASDPTRATFRRDGDEAAWVEARLLFRDRVLAVGRTALGPRLAPPAAATIGWRVHVEREPGVELEWSGREPSRIAAGFLLDGEDTVGVRTRRGELRSAWTWLTPGSLPDPSTASEVPLPAGGCDDPEFPRRAGAEHYGCSKRDGIVDRVARTRRTKAHPLPPGARVPAGRAATAGSELVWAAEQAGRWNGREVESRPLHSGGYRGRPAGDRTRTVFAREDRVEVMRRGTSQRSQIPAWPLDGASIVAIAGDRMALLEGTRGAGRIRLRRLDVHAEAVVAEGRDLRRPTLTRAHLLFIDDGRPRAISLLGGPDRTYPLVADATASGAVLDDYWLIAVRAETDGGDLWAIHLPTGVAGPWHEAPGHQEVRGAGAGAISWIDHSGAARLLTAEAGPFRVFEENGATAEQASGVPMAGGHGGRRLHLEQGEQHRMTLPDVAAGARLEMFRAPSSGTGFVTVKRSGREVQQPLYDPAEGPGWTLIPTVEAAREDPTAPLTIEFQGGIGGLDVDAVRLRAATRSM